MLPTYLDADSEWCRQLSWQISILTELFDICGWIISNNLSDLFQMPLRFDIVDLRFDSLIDTDSVHSIDNQIEPLKAIFAQA